MNWSDYPTALLMKERNNRVTAIAAIERDKVLQRTQSNRLNELRYELKAINTELERRKS